MKSPLPPQSRRVFLQAQTTLAVASYVIANEGQLGKDLWGDVPGLGKIIDGFSSVPSQPS